MTIRIKIRIMGLARISRISRPGALYDAPISAQTFEDVGRVLVNLIDFDGVVDAHVTKATGNLKFPQIRGYSEFSG